MRTEDADVLEEEERNKVGLASGRVCSVCPRMCEVKTCLLLLAAAFVRIFRSRL